MSNNFFREKLKINDLVAAPMAGITSPPFRKLLRDYFNGIVYTEMVSVEGISRNNPKSTEYLDIMDSEDRPVVAQLFGGNAEAYAQAVAVAEEYSSPDAYDINMGCPVKKVIKSGGGCALLTDLTKAAKIISAMRKGTTKPFSVKIRVGIDESKLIYKEMLDIAESEGADALIVHARTRSQMFGGRINYDALNELVSLANIPIIGNGGVDGNESYRLMKETGVDGVMIGTGMMYAPWIFKSIKEEKAEEGYLKPSQIYDMLLRLYSLMMQHADGDKNKESHYLNIIKKHAVWCSKGLQDSAIFRANVFKDQNSNTFLKLLRYFKGFEE